MFFCFPNNCGNVVERSVIFNRISVWIPPPAFKNVPTLPNSQIRSLSWPHASDSDDVASLLLMFKKSWWLVMVCVSQWFLWRVLFEFHNKALTDMMWFSQCCSEGSFFCVLALACVPASILTHYVHPIDAVSHHHVKLNRPSLVFWQVGSENMFRPRSLSQNSIICIYIEVTVWGRNSATILKLWWQQFKKGKHNRPPWSSTQHWK